MDHSDAILSVEFRLRGSTAASLSPYAKSFSTGEKIEGTATLCPRENMRFQDVSISFLGDEYTTVRHAKAHRQFLNMRQSVPDSLLPTPKLFTKGQKYDLEFSFTVPDHLSLNVCDHDTASRIVRQAHLRPPPSFGDPNVAGYGGKLLNDFAPRACIVVYTIQLTLRHNHPISGQAGRTLTKGLKVRIKPTTPSQPFPLREAILCTHDFPSYGKRTVLQGSPKPILGTLSMTIEEPTTFCLPLRDPVMIISSSVKIRVVYTTTGDPVFPQFKSVGGYLTSTTFFTATCHKDFPEKEKDFFGRPSNFDTVQFQPFSHSFTSLNWEPDGTDRYSATLPVPVLLPRENIIPTFHTCLLSRSYDLYLKVVVKDSAPFEFKVPAHVFAREDPLHLPSYGAAVELNSGTGDLYPVPYDLLEAREL
ncbi:hypothetical protein F5X98DRAFT_54365 [Xylaria grammica]|nr:hypothetical protein F5X98DRAFT_54365 [Xylaria grammica]